MSSFTSSKPSFDDAEMYVTKRNGKREVVSFDKILQRIKKVGVEVGIKINYTALAMKVIDQLYDSISTRQIDELTAEQCASMSSTHPDYNVLAGRITVSNHHKNTDSSFSKIMSQLYQFTDIHGQPSPLIAKELHQNIQTLGAKRLNALCDFSRDYFIDYFGFKTLERAYLMRIHKKIVERPQHMWLRVAIGIHGANWDKVAETYHYMSHKFFTHATPTLFNAGTPNPQLSSCYLMAMEDDSIDGIFNTLKDCALISKWAGGIGLHIHNVRSTGSHIRGTNGTSNGIVPMLKVFNNTAKYVDQGGGKRNGSFAIYLEPWHADIEMFLQMRKNHGDEELKARDLFYALWTPDLFMLRVKENKDWTLMCPSECPGLSDVYGDAFVQLYTKYESTGKGRKTMKARDLWFQILDAQMETGTPYLLYKDAANLKSNQKNLGTIKSSNLCVTPETLILTDQGQFPIYSLWAGNYPECEQERRKMTRVWNGSCFSEVEVKKTGKNKHEFINVYTSDGAKLTCTPYHKFYVVQSTNSPSNPDETIIVEVEAKDLTPNMILESCKTFPMVDPNTPPEGDGEALLLKPNETHEEVANELGCTSGIRNIKIPSDTSVQEPPIFVPINYDMKTKLQWFSGFVEPFALEYQADSDDQYIYVPSKSLVLLQDVKYMLQTCGVNAVIRTVHHTHNNTKIYELILHVCQIKQLMLFGLQFSMPNPEIQNHMSLTAEEFAYQPPIHVLSTEPVLGRVDDTYCFTEPMNHAGVFNGIRTGQCTEIIEYSDEQETAVCNLASIALPAFLRKPSETNPVEIESAKSTNGLIFDYSLLHEVTKVVTGNLNRIIDVNYYPTEKTRRSNMRHRPIGIGIQGLADVFLQLGWAFTSPDAKQLNKWAFETIYHASLERSSELAVEEGSYETFQGSPASEGILQFDMWETTPDSNMYDWNIMRENIRKNGLRNSLLLAPMPTASTSQILGYNECMEPITSNIYSRRTLAGEFILVNKYLMNEMLSLNMWNETLKNHMVANNGSIQDIEYIPKEIREKYKTVWEIPMRDLIDMSADRGAYICQSQSLNLWLEEPDYKTMTSMHFYSWSKGLKTGIYYLRRRPRHQPQQFTIEPGKAPSSTGQPQEEICEMCSA